jgi:PLP dependent protein
MDKLADRLADLRARIAAAAGRAGRPADAVELLAVAKTFPAEAVREAAAAGHILFGESRVQEAEAKIPQLPQSLRWHHIGHLQGNKVRRALPLFEALHGIDSAELAATVDRVAAELGLFPRVYLQVNLAGEASKFGFHPAALVAALEALLALPRLQIQGLMAIPPPRPSPGETRADFAALREFRDDLERRAGSPLPGLSMGMSDDFEPAIEEGATIVRVGSALFGKR